MESIIIAAITAIGGVITGIIGYRQFKQGQKTTKEQEFINDLLERVGILETRQDTLHDKFLETAAKAESERRALIAEYEQKIELVRKEMRRLIEDAQMELSMWRDKYFNLLLEYQTIKASHAELNVKLDKLDKDYQELRAKYEEKVRVNRDIGDTP